MNQIPAGSRKNGGPWAAAGALLNGGSLQGASRIRALLEAGNRCFGTGLGLVSRVEGPVYRVVAAVTDEPVLEPGAEFSLDETYCVHTLKADGALAFHCAGTSEIAGHPCYTMFRLETYIGAPLAVNGQCWGTVNCTAVEPRDPFEHRELELMERIADEVAREIGAGAL
ncbi:GAF domain-containing protein [Roseobacteraceae bacterium NS-SX3]